MNSVQKAAGELERDGNAPDSSLVSGKNPSKTLPSGGPGPGLATPTRTFEERETGSLQPKDEAKSPPFHLLRNNGLEDTSRKVLKKIKKELKRMKEKKKVKKSLQSFLGDKERYNFEEMLFDVKIGLKLNQNEQTSCSLRSALSRQTMAPARLVHLHPGQLAGFRINYASPMNFKLRIPSSAWKGRDGGGPEAATKTGSEKVFKVPKVPKVQHKRGPGRPKKSEY